MSTSGYKIFVIYEYILMLIVFFENKCTTNPVDYNFIVWKLWTLFFLTFSVNKKNTIYTVYESWPNCGQWRGISENVDFNMKEFSYNCFFEISFKRFLFYMLIIVIFLFNKIWKICDFFFRQNIWNIFGTKIWNCRQKIYKTFFFVINHFKICCTKKNVLYKLFRASWSDNK